MTSNGMADSSQVQQPRQRWQQRMPALSPALFSHWIAALLVAVVVVLAGLSPSATYAASGVKPGQRILLVEMTPAICELNASRSRTRQCLEGYALTVAGLDLGYGNDCRARNSIPDISPLQLRIVNRVMPDNVYRTQAWQRYGACSPMNANAYFRSIIDHAAALRLPQELNTGNSYTVTKSRFISQLTHLNPKLSEPAIDLICQDGNRSQPILTEIHICYQGTQFAACPYKSDSCESNFILLGGR